MSKQNNYLYEFGLFHLDTRERRLERDGKLVPLPPKAFDTLLVLIQNSGHLIEKSKLLEEIWPDSSVEEGNLSFNISIIRKALSDISTNPTYIETIPKRGYRFIAEVRELYHSDIKEHNDVEGITAKAQGIVSRGTYVPESEQKAYPQKMWMISLIIGAFLFLLITGVLVTWKYRQATTSQAPEIHSIINISPPIAGQQFYIQIKGRGIDPNNARVVVIGLGCQDFGSCNVPNNVLHWYGNVIESQIERVPLTLAPGDFQIFVQNGPEGGISNALPFTVKLD